MPKADAKRKVAGAAGGAKKGAAAGPKKAKLYNMPEKIKEGTILRDLMKTEWKIGPSIGTGGFGEIYSACRKGESKYDFVVKCEPHDNGPLFVEMHFYMRNAKLDDIRRFQKEHDLKSLGMPYMVGNGSAEINGIKHRFIVMPRYGSDVAKHFLSNGRRLPEGTCYRLALQMLDVYAFIHGCGYVHADLKAANILLGYGPKQQSQAYLVDFGLASHYTTKDFKPDPKKMHNGTIEYTSRDAHLGVPTMRADLEILGYNLIEWLGVELPWVRDKLLAVPTKVQKAKEGFMADIAGNLKKLFSKTTPPAVILDFMKYVAKMEYNETPDYEKCRKMFQNALKVLKFPTTGDLDFKIKASTANEIDAPLTTSKAKSKGKKEIPLESDGSEEEEVVIKAKSKPKGRLRKEASPAPEASDDEVTSFKRKKELPVELEDSEDEMVKRKSKTKGSLRKEPSPELEESDDEVIIASDDDDDDVMFEPKKSWKKETKRVLKTTTTTKTTPKLTPRSTPRSTPKISPAKLANSSLKRKSLNSSSPKLSPSPSKRSRLNGSGLSPKNTRVTPLKRSPRGGNISAVASPRLRHTPLNAKANIRMSPAISMSSSRSGKTIINDRLTPNKKPTKTYEFNFELDVSMDANVIVNVKRKKKPLQPSQEQQAVSTSTTRSTTPSGSKSGGGSSSTPVTKVNVRKVASGAEDVSSPRTPAVTVKKSRRIVNTPT